MPATSSILLRALALWRMFRNAPPAPRCWRAKCACEEAINSFDQPADSLDRSGLLLARCRSELSEALDDKKARTDRRQESSAFSIARWWMAARGVLVYHPVASMAVLVVAGFLAGVGAQRLHFAPAVASRPALTVSATPKLTEQQLQSAGSADVAWVTPADSREPTVQVNLMSPMPMSIIGSPADSDVQRALSFFLENGQRFDSDVRLDRSAGCAANALCEP